MNKLLRWFSGGDSQYVPLWDMMRDDALWFYIILSGDSALSISCFVFAFHWNRSLARAPVGSQTREALAHLRNAFLLSGVICFFMVILRTIWPAWRLYALLLLVLVISLTRYLWSARGHMILLNALEENVSLIKDVVRLQEESRQKADFLNAISHDLRTPLHNLRVLAFLLRRSAKDCLTSESVEFLVQMDDVIERCSEILSRFLELARLDWVERIQAIEEVNLAESIQRVTNPFRVQAKEKGLSFEVRCPTILRMETDPVKVERILENLLSNALKFTTKGSIRVLASERPHDRICIEVEDTGDGVPPELVSRLGVEFFQVGEGARTNSSGSGLGLSIVKRLVVQLGGVLEVESRVKFGTTFRVVLPRVSPVENGNGAKTPAGITS